MLNKAKHWISGQLLRAPAWVVATPFLVLSGIGTAPTWLGVACMAGAWLIFGLVLVCWRWSFP